MRVFVVIQRSNTRPSPAGIFDIVLGGDADEIHCAIIHHFFDNTVRKMSNLHPVSHSKMVCGCSRVLCCVTGFLVRVAILYAFLRSFLPSNFFSTAFCMVMPHFLFWRSLRNVPTVSCFLFRASRRRAEGRLPLLRYHRCSSVRRCIRTESMWRSNR